MPLPTSASPRWVALARIFIFIYRFYRQTCTCARVSKRTFWKKNATRVRDRELRKRVLKRERESCNRQADRQERKREASKQAGQIRESRKRGRLQFALWSSLRNETADWRDGVFVPRGKKNDVDCAPFCWWAPLCEEEMRSLPRLVQMHVFKMSWIRNDDSRFFYFFLIPSLTFPYLIFSIFSSKNFLKRFKDISSFR